MDPLIKSQLLSAVPLHPQLETACTHGSTSSQPLSCAAHRSVNNELSSREPVLGLGPGLCETPQGLIFNNFLQQLRFTIWWRRCND